MQLELKVPWIQISAADSPKFVAELVTELGVGYPLWGKEVHALARAMDSDNGLFLIGATGGKCAVVHLTWSGQLEPDSRWPRSESFSSIPEWYERRMEPDHLACTNVV